MFKTTLALCLLAAAPAAARAGEPPAALTLENAFAVLAGRKIPDGRLYAPFYLGVIGPHAVAERGTIFVTFQNARGRPIVMAYRPDARRWAGPVKAADFGLERDDHGNPAIAIDRRGRLHVFYGCHGGAMRNARSRKPWDISAWEDMPPPTPRATYPQVMRLADGSLALFYRAGGHPDPWCLRVSTDDGLTWSEPQRVIEMRKAPRDPRACAYAYSMPGARGRTIHCFWNHKDDNAARVSPTRPHPWRPLKYPGLHEAVYRYNVYYIRRDPDGVWKNAAGQPVALPVSKAEADAKCLAYDSGDEFTFLGTRLAVDKANRPYISFGTGVVDWVRRARDTAAGRTPREAIVPVTRRFATFSGGKWQVEREMPSRWPADVRRVLRAPGYLAWGDEWPSGHWFIAALRRPAKAGLGCAVLLFHDEKGFATHPGGPALVE